ncbi:hypothetical protein YWS52_27220 [Chitiniphilus shinanonensis]
MVLPGIGVDLEYYADIDRYPDSPVFLMVSRLLVEKGVREFVAAARLVKARYSNARFLLAGGLDSNPGGIEGEEVKSWVSEGVLDWVGHVEDIRTVFAESSVFVLPSYREGRPRSTQEAMAMARPIITTDAIGCRETVDEGVNGFRVPVRNVAALAEAMNKFIETPDLVRKMGRQSRRIAEEKYNVHEINAAILRAMSIVVDDSHPAVDG